MPIFVHGVGVAQIREGGTGAAATQAWYNGFLIFDGTFGAIVVGRTGVLGVASEPGIVRGGAVVAGMTGTIALTPIDGVVSVGAVVTGSTGAVVVTGVAGVGAQGQTVVGTTAVMTVVGREGQASAAQANQAIGVSGAITVAQGAGVASAGQIAVGSTALFVVAGVAGTVTVAGTAIGSTGVVTVAGVAAVITAGVRIAGSTGAVTVAGVAGVVNSGQKVIGSTGVITVAGVAGTAFEPDLVAMGVNKSTASQVVPVSVWTKVAGFDVRSGFPDTVIINDALVMNSSGTGTITFRGTFMDNTGTQNLRAYVNGAAVGSTVNETIVGTVSGQSVTAGTTVELWAFSSGSTASRTVRSGSAYTYIYFTPD